MSSPSPDTSSNEQWDEVVAGFINIALITMFLLGASINLKTDGFDGD
jgi:hypothetical protein